ncbi:hypothetical protein DC31_08235 [Microbacterium sp. CH12i]|uniref:hypothetical protein n=1 Tax=Microbacterium sp. CH12i TaxID=1479651 RepID=UPI000460F4ED|nr:hypothetical protein [Microbacterium sp. CH12i]KDA06665.1 hypothetical protein DC31_08235 [Microbacterium sp. CH12i]
MNEIQGPTPTGTSRPFKTLQEGLRAHRVPEENHDFISSIIDAVGITALIDRGRYIEAIRRDEGPTLHIGKTYTNGFMDGEQIIVGSAALRLQRSEGRAPYLYVSHPSEFRPLTPAKTASKRSGASRPSTPRAEPALRASKPIERDYGFCDVCFMVRTASGTCNCD